MLAATPKGTTMNSTAPSEESQQLQDLEGLAQRLRALEKLLANPPAPKPLVASNEPENPTEEAPEDNASRQSQSQHQHQHHSGRHGHSHHSHHGNQHQSHQTPGSLSRRIQKIDASLWAATKERKPIDEFLQKYEASKLLSNHGSHSDRELLSLQAKTELILAAQGDLQKLAEESKEIQNLERCAEIGGLKNVEPQYPVLSKLETVHIEQCQEADKVSNKMNKLTDDYNSLINTLSEIFLSWDTLLTAAELKVSEVERSRS